MTAPARGPSPRHHELVVSSRNPHKLAELRALLAGLPFQVVTAAERGVGEVEETGATFEDNALLKAAAAFERTGEACLADDSGLEVDTLGGAPGVLSARFAGPDVTYADNNRHLLDRLRDVPEAGRGAAFTCTLALLVPRDRAVRETQGDGWRLAERADVPQGACLYVLEGRVEGRILRALRGDGGFGYDPLFLYPPTGETFAEMDAAAKNRISHRGRAFRGLRGLLEAVAARRG